MAPGSTTPVSSANSYSDADVRVQSVWQAEVNRFKVAQLDELLRAKGVKPKGVKAEEEITEWRAKQETLTPPALLSTPRPSQPTLDTYFSAHARCTHDWVREFPSGPRDNGEYRDICRLCGAER